ncbi:MAG: PRC-barrel domain-containing protein [Peptococcia bacterium]
MRKGRELQNLPVIETTRGKVLGTISALLVADEHKLDGLYFLTEDRKTCFLPMERVVKIGRDAVFVQGGDEDFGLAKDSKPQTTTAAVVMTSSGRSMGTIDDILLEEKEGNIVAYEVSDGHLMDILVGKRIVPVEDIISYGQDTVIVNREV